MCTQEKKKRASFVDQQTPTHQRRDLMNFNFLLLHLLTSQHSSHLWLSRHRYLFSPEFHPEKLPLLGGLTQHLLYESNPLRKHKLPWSSLNWKEVLYFRIQNSPGIKKEIPAICSNRVISPSLSHWNRGKDSSHDLINSSIISIHALPLNLICIFP